MTRYSATMSEALKKIRNYVSERELTDAEEKRREEIAKDLSDQEFKDRYGARWKEVKMATATKMVKKENLDEAVRWRVKIEGLPPVYMDAGSAGEVKSKLIKIVKNPKMLQDIERVTDTQMKKDLKDRLAGKDKEDIKEARERPARQLLNPNKEEMVVKKNEVIVIDKKDLDKYLKKGWALAEEVELDEYKKVDIKFHKGSIKTALPKVVDFINKTNKKRKVKIKVTQNMSDDSLTLDGGKYDINREVADIMNFIGGKNAKVVESVEEKTFSQKVKESITEFDRASLLAEDNVDVLRSIVKSKQAKPIKLKDGTMKIDMQTANMMLKVLDKVKPANQKKLTKMMNGKKSEFMKVHGFVMKAFGK